MTTNTNKVRQVFKVQGVEVTTLTDEVLKKALINRNFVILLATYEHPLRPVFYQRVADYIDKESLDRIGLVEINRDATYIGQLEVQPKSFPMSYQYIVDFLLKDK